MFEDLFISNISSVYFKPDARYYWNQNQAKIHTEKTVEQNGKIKKNRYFKVIE